MRWLRRLPWCTLLLGSTLVANRVDPATSSCWALAVGGSLDAVIRSRSWRQGATWAGSVGAGLFFGLVTAFAFRDPDGPFYLLTLPTQVPMAVCAALGAFPAWLHEQPRWRPRLQGAMNVCLLLSIFVIVGATLLHGDGPVVVVLSLALLAGFLWAVWSSVTTLTRGNRARQEVERNKRRRPFSGF